MSIRYLAPVLIAAVVLIAPIGAQEPQSKFKVSTNSVALYATVTDTTKRLVPDLVEEDFEVYDNGKLQTVTQFDNKPLPISVVVMLDTSGSMQAQDFEPKNRLFVAKEVVKEFIGKRA